MQPTRVIVPFDQWQAAHAAWEQIERLTANVGYPELRVQLDCMSRIMRGSSVVRAVPLTDEDREAAKRRRQEAIAAERKATELRNANVQGRKAARFNALRGAIVANGGRAKFTSLELGKVLGLHRSNVRSYLRLCEAKGKIALGSQKGRGGGYEISLRNAK